MVLSRIALVMLLLASACDSPTEPVCVRMTIHVDTLTWETDSLSYERIPCEDEEDSITFTQ